MRWASGQEAILRRHGEREFPQECCGVLLGDREGGESIVREVRPLINAARENREREFSVAPDAIRDLLDEERRTGREILGFYHSHPNHPARPSATDRDNAWEGWATVILSVRQGLATELTVWNYDEAEGVFHPETPG